MIRVATAEDLARPFTDETAIRIGSLYRAYGLDVPFIRYYSDGVGGLLAIMDGVGLFSPAGEATEEWITFLQMNPEIFRLHCPADVGQAVAAADGWSCSEGPVLRYEGEPCLPASQICREPSLPAVYALLEQYFDSLPPLDAWYPDVSHRVRHGCCRLACVIDGNAVVSTAMTVAESENAAVLGQVATAATHRRRGYAGMCIQDLISRCKASELYILPLNEMAERLYISLGFRPCDRWAELKRL